MPHQPVYLRIEEQLRELRREQEARLERIEDKLDQRMTELDHKVDSLASRQDRLEGRLHGVVGMVKWLGPSAIVALVIGMARAAGLI